MGGQPHTLLASLFSFGEPIFGIEGLENPGGMRRRGVNDVAPALMCGLRMSSLEEVVDCGVPGDEDKKLSVPCMPSASQLSL